jgi:methylthioribulose-1-phosphate dehydratase
VPSSILVSPEREMCRPLCQAIAQVDHRGWCRGTSGNFSLRAGRHPLRLFITPSGWNKGRVAVDDLLLVDGEGRVLDGAPDRRPSAETLLHCWLGETRDAGAVLHTHSVAATVLSRRYESAGALHLEGYEMLKGLRGIDTHRAVVEVPIVPNSQDMPELRDELERRRLDGGPGPPVPGFLLAGHGLYTWGADLDEAVRHLEIFEFLFECVLRAETLAVLPNTQTLEV